MKKIIPSITLILIFAIWQILYDINIINNLFIVSPLDLLNTLIEKWDFLLINTIVTLKRTLIGFIIGIVLGIVFGILTGWNKLSNDTIGSVLYALYNIPKFTLLPIFILWLGLNENPVILIIALSAFFPTYINTNSGVKRTDSSYIEMIVNLGGKNFDVIRKVIIPGVLPFISAGMKLSIRMALIGAVTSEMFISNSGLGAVIWTSGELFRINLMLLCPILLGLIGFVLFRLYDFIERKFLLKYHS